MNPLIERLGWTLLHSLWQGALAWAVLRIALSLLRRHSAQARYLAACGALALATVAPWITFFQLDVTQRLSGITPPPATTVVIAPTGATSVTASSSPAPLGTPLAAPPAAQASARVGSVRLASVLRPAFPWLVGLWLIGFTGSCLRLLFGWRQTRALARGPRVPPSAELEARFASLLARMQLRRAVRIGLSAWVQGPAVVGWLRPVVLLPVEALAGLTPGQIDALLTHELAHIHRADFLVNLLQAVTEALFFYHPAIHAINRVIREEREHACDDLAVTLTGDPVGYARALATLATHGVPPLAVAAAGTDGTGGLIDRIRRLLGPAPERPRPFVTLAWAALTGAVLYLVAMLGLPALTARMLTPAERIAIVKETAAAVAAQATPAFPEGTRMTVVCEVRTEDGSPLPANLKLTGFSQNRRRSMFVDLRVINSQVRESVEAGEFRLLVYAPGWAPTFAGPFYPTRADEELILPPLILRRGFPVRLRITDDHARPLAGVRLHHALFRQSGPAAERNLNRSWPDLVIDANGEAVFANVHNDTELEVMVEIPGFQKDVRRFDGFTPDTPIVFPLTPARPLSGHVTDADTGAAIPGAQILLAGNQRPDTNFAHSLESAPRLAITDETGQFVIDTLNERWITYVYVIAPGYAPLSVEVNLGTPLHVKLDRGIRVTGRVRAAAGQLTDPAHITASYSLQATSSSSYMGHRVEQHLDFASPEPAFAFDLLPRSSGAISISIAGRSLSLRNDRDHLDLLIDLTATAKASDAPDTVALGELPKRKVVLTLRPPAGEPMPEGELEFSYLKHGLNRADNSIWPSPRFPVRQGQVELLLPAPNRIELTQARLPGYAPVTRTFEIPEGTAPLSLDLDVVAAGAIHGRLTDVAGTPVPGWWLTCRSSESSDFQRAGSLSNAFWGEQKINVAGAFIAGGLPFDHGYFIVAHRDFFYATSDTIRLTRREPIHALEWRLPTAAAYTGRLVGPDGVPVSAASLELSFHDRTDRTFSSGNRIMTEADGTFEIPGINPAELERYRLKLISRKNWQPFIAALSRAPSVEGRIFTLKAGHRLSGRVLDAVTGHPLRDVDVQAQFVRDDLKDVPPQLRQAILAESKTDADGRFQFSTFPAGKFRIAADQGNVESPVVTLPAQAGTNVDVRLKPWSRKIRE